MTKRKFYRIGNIITYVIMVAVNALANTLPLFGRTTGDISDGLANLFVPSGYVFSIWGVIYLLLGTFVIYQALPAQKDNPVVDKIGPWFIIGNLLNTGWVFAWHSLSFLLSEIAMLGILASLMVIYLRLDLGGGKTEGIENWTVWAPFSVYFGWISVASIANTAIALLDLGWNGFGIAPKIWTVIMLVIAGLLSIAMTIQRRELPYTLVIIWALIGIALRQVAFPVISTTAVIFTVILVLLLILGVINRRNMKSAV